MTVREQFINSQKSIQEKVGENRLVCDDASGLYLSNQLEIIDPTLYAPLTKFFWYKDMPIRYGGGAIEDASFFKINYAITKNQNQATGSNNSITTYKTEIEKFRTRVKPFAMAHEIGWVDQMKIEQVGFDQLGWYDKVLRVAYNKQLDDIAFFGFDDLSDSYGLFNNTNVTSKVLSKTVANMTGSDWLDALMDAVVDIIKGMDYDETYAPNRILLPIEAFTELRKPLAIGSTPLATSVIDYLVENLNKGLGEYNVDITLAPNKYLDGKGTNSTGRVVVYRYDEEVVRMPLPMELTPGATVFDPSSFSTKTPYVAFIGEPQFIYLSAIRYLDGASS